MTRCGSRWATFDRLWVGGDGFSGPPRGAPASVHAIRIDRSSSERVRSSLEWGGFGSWGPGRHDTVLYGTGDGRRDASFRVAGGAVCGQDLGHLAVVGRLRGVCRTRAVPVPATGDDDEQEACERCDQKRQRWAPPVGFVENSATACHQAQWVPSVVRGARGADVGLSESVEGYLRLDGGYW